MERCSLTASLQETVNMGKGGLSIQHLPVSQSRHLAFGKCGHKVVTVGKKNSVLGELGGPGNICEGNDRQPFESEPFFRLIQNIANLLPPQMLHVLLNSSSTFQLLESRPKTKLFVSP